jgi:hypothetical protein
MKKPFLLLLAGVAFLVASCGVQVDSVIGADRKATIQVQASFHPVLQAYLEDLVGKEKTDSIINAPMIRARLSEEAGVTIRNLEASLKTGLKMNLDVADLRKLFTGKDSVAKGIITMSVEGGSTRVTVHLDRKAIESFMALGMEKNDQSLKYLLPQNATVTAEKYQENLRWALEEYGTADQLADLFKTSTIVVRLSVPGAIKSSSGFTVTDKAGGKLQLSLSLLDLLTLQGVRTYEFVY